MFNLQPVDSNFSSSAYVIHLFPSVIDFPLAFVVSIFPFLIVTARWIDSVTDLLCDRLQVKEETQQPQMVFTVRHATVTFQTDGDTWREQKEKKAALMVGILIGVFVLCWIPFFITELIVPLCSCDIPPIWKSIFLWLGYSNSFFNPLIYTAFNKNYNNALRNLFSRQRWDTVPPPRREEPTVEPQTLYKRVIFLLWMCFVYYYTDVTSQLDWKDCLRCCSDTEENPFVVLWCEGGAFTTPSTCCRFRLIREEGMLTPW